MSQPKALRHAQELDRRGLLEEATELRRLHDLLGKANALCRIRAAEIERLKAERSELMAARDAAFAALRVRNIHGAGAVELSAAPTHRPAQGWVPRDGHQWFEHTPGDPCPVAGDVEVEVVAYHQRQTLSWKPRAFLARRWDWSSIVAWRPA